MIGCLLLALNLIALVWLWRGGHVWRPKSWRPLGVWLLAQSVILLLWLPWLPIAVRQVTDPPVPSWRTGWASWFDFFHSLAEGLAALMIEQTPPGDRFWPWALLGALLVGWTITVWQPASALHGLVRSEDKSPDFEKPATSYGVLLLYVLLPMALIYLVSGVIAPIYHVRYLFPFAAPFVILMAAALMSL